MTPNPSLPAAPVEAVVPSLPYNLPIQPWEFRDQSPEMIAKINAYAESFARSCIAAPVGAVVPSDEQIGLHPDTADLVDRFVAALKEKLRAAEVKYGYEAHWARPDWMDECRQHLIEHVTKGDPRDVAAYCAFLWHHGESTASPAPPGQPLRAFEIWLRTVCFQKPTPEAYDLAKESWHAALALSHPAVLVEQAAPSAPLAEAAKALQELVALKDMKDWMDTHAVTEEWSRKRTEYLCRKPLAWVAARAVLAEPAAPLNLNQMIISLLITGGHVSQQKVDQAAAIALTALAATQPADHQGEQG